MPAADENDPVTSSLDALPVSDPVGRQVDFHAHRRGLPAD
jgi:hypothetical protein